MLKKENDKNHMKNDKLTNDTETTLLLDIIIENDK